MHWIEWSGFISLPDTVFCAWVRHFTLIVPNSPIVYLSCNIIFLDLLFINYYIIFISNILYFRVDSVDSVCYR